MKMVLIHWLDAEHPEADWIHKEDMAAGPDLGVETCGFLVYEDKTRVRVAVSVASRDREGEQYAGTMTIPRGCITSMRTISEPKKSRR